MIEGEKLFVIVLRYGPFKKGSYIGVTWLSPKPMWTASWLRGIKPKGMYSNQATMYNTYPELKSAVPSLPIPQPPKEPKFTCPVCMGPLVKEISTKCGHIFCKTCIKTAIAAQNKCPTCRRKITMKDTIRFYLPATTSA
ncbi:RING/U-box superfamily protein [Forsythia ovata]|uniref:RING/U-box superfamily protein n=1 Tax=Forsythia ovata TaxID=205694 RepID=A0ABD1WJ08_9LAMI